MLDGLEKVQDDGARGGVFGALQDGRLSDLLVRVAEGYLPQRQRADHQPLPAGGTRRGERPITGPIAVEEIEPSHGGGLAAAAAESAARTTSCGRSPPSAVMHALTVDLAGGYIAEFGGGDPATPLHLTRFDDDEQARRAEPTNARRRRGAVAGIPLRPHRRALPRGLQSLRPRRDGAAGADLPVPPGRHAGTLASIFTGEGEESSASPAPRWPA